MQFWAGKNAPSDLSSSTFFLMKIVRSLLSDRRKKRFRKRTFIGFTPMTRVNTIWGKSPALYLEGYVLVLFNHICYTLYIFDMISEQPWGYNWLGWQVGRQEEEVDESSCSFCLSTMEGIMEYKFKQYRNFRRQLDRMTSNMKLMGMISLLHSLIFRCVSISINSKFTDIQTDIQTYKQTDT